MRKVSVRISLRYMLRPIRVDTLRRVHNVGFLVEWLKFMYDLNLIECHLVNHGKLKYNRGPGCFKQI